MELDEEIDVERFMDDPVIQALVRQNDELGEAIAREQEKEEKLLGEINRLDFENVQLRKMEKDSHSLMAEVHQNAQRALQYLLEVVDNTKAILEMSNVTKIDWRSPAKTAMIEKPPIVAASTPMTRRSVARRESFSVSSTVTRRAVSSTYNQVSNSRTCRIVLEPLNMASMANENNDEELIPNVKTNNASTSNNSSVALSTITEENSIPESTFTQTTNRSTQEPYVCLTRLPQTVIEGILTGNSTDGANMSRLNNTPLAEMSNNFTHSPGFFSSPISSNDQTSLLRELGLEPADSAKLRTSMLENTHRYVSTRRGAIIRKYAMSASTPLPSPSTSGTTSRRSSRMPKEELVSPIVAASPQQQTVKRRKKEEKRIKQDLENNSPKTERPKRKARPQVLKEATLNRKMRRS